MKTARLFFLLTLAISLPVALKPAWADTAPATTNEDDPWTAIENLTYEKRADFATGAGRLLEKLNAEIRKLNTKRATLPETSVKDWDFAMKEVNEAHTDLESSIMSLSEATSETWSQAKDKVGHAWQRSKDACDKVRNSTTT